MKVVSIVGLAGSGKSEVARIFEEHGYARIRFGDLTDREIEARELATTEENERYVRELLRKERGMAAYAELNLPLIDEALRQSNVVVDGLYSWEEYKLMKARYGAQLRMVAVCAPPAIRYERLGLRAVRGLTREDAEKRDIAEIENVHKAGPIVMADYAILNESSLDDLRRQTERVVHAIEAEITQA